MIICACGASSNVLDSRDIGVTKRRRRCCKECGKRWTTLEIRIASRKGSKIFAATIDAEWNALNKKSEVMAYKNESMSIYATR